jgi:hypothetical protein
MFPSDIIKPMSDAGLILEQDPYAWGYTDAKMGNRRDPLHGNDEEYELGYLDGLGDKMNQDLAAAVRPVDDERALGDPPLGFEWTGEKKTPEPGEYYLTKNGNAKLAEKVRGNAQTRHILRRIQ